MRYEFGRVITEIAEKDPLVHLIVGDIGFGVFDEFRKKFPDRFMNIGICEQAMISFAAGMALEGAKPWVYTITTFLTERPFEQLKIDVNQQRAPVKLVGYADYKDLGPTHIPVIDRSLGEHLKNIKCYYPNNSVEARNLLYEAYEHNGPTFVSLKKNPQQI